MFTPRYQFPSDCLDLIHGRDAFTFSEWQHSLRDMKVFRISGINNLLAPMSAQYKGAVKQPRQLIEPLKVIQKSIRHRVPNEWRAYFGNEGSFDELGAPQLKALHGSEPQHLDRALTSVVYAVEFIERVLHEDVPPDFLKTVQIVPIMLRVSFENPAAAKVFSTDNELKAALGYQKHDQVMAAVLAGQRVTSRTARIVQEVARAHGIAATIDCPIDRGGCEANALEPLDICRMEDQLPIEDFISDPVGD